MYSVLLVEDDQQLSEVTSAYLEVSGYRVATAASAEACWQQLEHQDFDVIILDLGLPDEDGLVLLRKLSTSGNQTPVLVCSGRGSDEDRIAGLEFGANDYLAKPFRVKELLLRINLLVANKVAVKVKINRVALDGVVIEIDSRYVTDSAGEEISLTAQEQAVLFLLVENTPKVFSREEVIDATRLSEGPESIRAIDTIVSRLRKKLEPDNKKPKFLKTVQGVGYRFLIK
mgnify:CR=1 FL=1